jgi:hypothetical protein
MSSNNTKHGFAWLSCIANCGRLVSCLVDLTRQGQISESLTLQTGVIRAVPGEFAVCKYLSIIHVYSVGLFSIAGRRTFSGLR